MLAAAALKAVHVDKQTSYRVTLPDQRASGKTRWTQYECWSSSDHVIGQPAVLVSTFSVTHQRELELQLQTAKDQLER